MPLKGSGFLAIWRDIKAEGEPAFRPVEPRAAALRQSRALRVPHSREGAGVASKESAVYDLACLPTSEEV